MGLGSPWLPERPRFGNNISPSLALQSGAAPPPRDAPRLGGRFRSVTDPTERRGIALRNQRSLGALLCPPRVAGFSLSRRVGDLQGPASLLKPLQVVREDYKRVGLPLALGKVFSLLSAAFLRLEVALGYAVSPCPLTSSRWKRDRLRVPP